jgi:hypothetical protein
VLALSEQPLKLSSCVRLVSLLQKLLQVPLKVLEVFSVVV